MSTQRGGYTPSLEKFLDSLKSRPVQASVELLISLLRRRQIKGAEASATATAHILLQVVARDKWANVDQLLGRIQLIGRKLVAAQPHELAIGNIVRRVLGLIRDEAEEDRNDASTDSPRPASPPVPAPSHASSPPKPVRPPNLSSLGSFARTQSMFNLLSDPNVFPPTGSNASTPGQLSGASTPILNPQPTNVSALRSEVIDGIQEIMDEIKMVDEQVQAYADIFIHPGDYILVYQPSRTVQKFLTRAAAKRKFTVFLVVDPSSAATGPDSQYASLVKSMVSNGSSIITVLNAGLMAYMSRVDKVILGARAITAQGGVIVDAGAAAIARAARERRRTVIVLGGVYKLSPESKLLPESQIEWGDASKHVNFTKGDLVSPVKVKNAVSEFLPADQVDTYITNLGAHAQENLHTIIADHYKEEDINFDLYGRVQR
ncbi:initiation factor 2 subunit family protein [Xylaria sp. FL0064]|nr:initiation factor 2 subunit family protein [Xylaria sp. FL0064]